MEKTQLRNKRIFAVLMTLGILGLIDFLSRGFITPIFNESFGANAQSIGLGSALMFDWFRGAPSVAGFAVVVGTLLGDIWWLFLLMAYALHRNMKAADKAQTARI
jgi:hypothetical protein